MAAPSLARVGAWYRFAIIPVAKTLVEEAKQGMFIMQKKIGEIKWKEIPRKILNYVKSNPGKVAFFVFMLIMLIAPHLIIGPVLGAMGFSAAGPVAGSLAAGIQASIGAVSAGSLFAIAQSAAMGGFGMVILGTAFQVAVGVVAAACAAIAAKMGWREIQPDRQESKND